MSLEKESTMKPIPWVRGEGRRDEIRLGKSASEARSIHHALNVRSAPESKHNRCKASHHRHGGVGGVGMLRRSVEIKNEILSCAQRIRINEQQTSQARESEDVLAWEEVGKAHSSVDALVMRSGAKEPYFVDVNLEAKEV